MYNAKAYSAGSATSPLAQTTIARRDPTETDVQIEILFCGICATPISTEARNEWSGLMPTDIYPVRSGPRDCRACDEGWVRGEEVQGR